MCVVLTEVKKGNVGYQPRHQNVLSFFFEFRSHFVENGIFWAY